VYSLAAVAPNDIWAVGYYWLSGQRHTTMILHWDGSAWSVVPSPNASSFDNHLFAVDALAANDIWAVGRYMEISGRWLTLTLHWEGSAWSIVPSPNVSSINNHLLSVSMLSSSDGWAAGFLCPHGNCFEGHFSSQTEELFILHWDGSAWSIMESPKLDADFAFFKDVLAASPGNVWAVGGYGSNDDPKSLVMRWDGSAWELYTAPSPSESCCPLLDSVTALPNGDMWAVGDYHFPAHIVFRTLAAYYPASCGVTVTPTPLSSTATATRTPIPPTLTATSPPAATSTPTSIPATGTPLAATATSTATNTATNTGVPTSTSTDTPTPPVPTQTPTSCSIIFSDVPEGSTFHTPVRCLACRGILGGYSDGTFRPGDPVTRGQIAKIVSNAAGWSDVPAGQSFEDAQPEHTFYLWIERMFSRGIINGYPCGGPGEPCNPPGGRPYFRPAAATTRGQTAKIVSNAFFPECASAQR
jgi:hypothetical protein